MEGSPKLVNVRIPRDILRRLLDKPHEGIPFQTDELGSPLRIILWGAPARTPRQFKPAKPKTDDDET